MIVYPLVNIHIAIENGPVEIVDLPVNSMVIFHGYVNVYRRVIMMMPTHLQKISKILPDQPPLYEDPSVCDSLVGRCCQNLRPEGHEGPENPL